MTCIICCTDLNLGLGVGVEVEGLKLNVAKSCKDSTLSKELDIFFVLRNVLQLPSKLLEECLKCSGGSGGVAQWGIKFCPLCSRMIQETGFVFSRINSLMQDYDHLCKMLRERAKVEHGDDWKEVNVEGEGGVESMEECGERLRGRGRGKVHRRSTSGGGGGSRGRVHSHGEDSVLSRIQKYFMEGSLGAGKMKRKLEASPRTDSLLKSTKSGTIFSGVGSESSSIFSSRKRNTFSKRDRGRGRPPKRGRLIQNSALAPQIPDESEEVDQDQDVVVKEVQHEGQDLFVVNVKSEPEEFETYFNDALHYEGSESGVHVEGTEDPLEQEESNVNTNKMWEEFDADQDAHRRRSLRQRKQIRKIVVDKDMEEGSDGADADELEEDEFNMEDNNFDDESDEQDDNIDSDYKIKSRNRNSGTHQRTSNSKSFVTVKTDADESGSNKRKWIKCPWCPCANRSKFSMDLHVLRVHQGIERNFPCDLCPLVFTKLAKAMMHIDIHHHPEIVNSDEPLRDNEFEEDTGEYKLFNTVFEAEEIENEDPQIDVAGTQAQRSKCDNKPESGTENPLAKKPSSRRKKKVNPALPHACPSCTYNFSLKWVLNAHILRCHYKDKQAFQCDICPKRFAAKVTLMNHRKDTHPKITTTYEGPQSSLEERIAELPLKKKKPKIVDIPISKMKTVFTCRKCDIKFPSRIACEVHLKRAHQGPESKLQCSECELYFLTTPGRRIHHEQFHVKKLGSKHKSLSCNECDLEFKTQTDLATHIQNHPDRAKLMCELCPLFFGKVVDLTNHQRRVHHEKLGLNPFKCEVCDKVLNTRRGLYLHRVAAHTKEYPFPCPHCPQGFASEPSLRNHVRAVHLKDKPFKCPHFPCEKRFSQSFNLKSHVRIHTGDKPWVCKFCQKAYSDKPTYNRHIQTHGNQIHKCPTCKKEYKVWHTFRLHCMSHDKSMKTRKPTSRRKGQLKNIDYEVGDNSSPEQELPSDSNSGRHDSLAQGESNSSSASNFPIAVQQDCPQDPQQQPIKNTANQNQLNHYVSPVQNSVFTFPFLSQL